MGMTLIARTYWRGMPFDFSRPPDAIAEPLKLFTPDARELRGLMWLPKRGTPRIFALLMHPRVDFTRHYAIPRLTAANLGVLAINSRNPNDDTDTVHEELALDVAASVDYLRRDRRAEHVVLIGNSGGGAMMALYASEASKPKHDRIERTPAGDRTKLTEVDLPLADALVLIAAHRGEGRVLARTIDPSVVDESDPSRADPSLDMYASANGFRPAPAWTRYEPSFAARYRAAQLDRVRRIDAIARAIVEQTQHAIRAKRAPGFETLPFSERQAIERAAHLRRVLVVYRTMANLDYVDRDLDPSPRGYGSLLSERPDLMNYSLPGFARTVTPRAWLSTWSALSSNADLVRCLSGIRMPVLAIHAQCDKEIFPQDAHAIRDAIASEDRTFVEIEGAGHYFEPPFENPEDASHRERAMDVVTSWIEQRFA
jgi:pimeloyl-ACP methyl ester carboxylesterase